MLSVIFVTVMITGCEDSPVTGNRMPGFTLAEVKTLPPTLVTVSNAIVGGEILSTGGALIFESGICYSKSTNPTISDNLLIKELYIGKFEILIPQLDQNTTYHYRAYTKNEVGISYGEDYVIVTSNGTVRDFDGNVYQTVKIGDQVWMRENIKTMHYSSGKAIDGVIDSKSDAAFGFHYTWEAINVAPSGGKFIINRDQGVCPDGWHIPSDMEWQALFSYVGGVLSPTSDDNIYVTIMGNMFREAGTDHWGTNGGDNYTGFTALPAGHCIDCVAEYISCQANFWTSTPKYCYTLFDDSDQVLRRRNDDGNCSLSVRCIKNDPK